MTSTSKAWYSPVMGVYMSEAESREERGKILVELDDVKTQLEKRHAQASRLADDLRLIAGLLETTPERIVFSDEETLLEFQNTQLANAGALDLSTLREIRDAIRTLELRRRELERRRQAY